MLDHSCLDDLTRRGSRCNLISVLAYLYYVGSTGTGKRRETITRIRNINVVGHFLICRDIVRDSLSESDKIPKLEGRFQIDGTVFLFETVLPDHPPPPPGTIDLGIEYLSIVKKGSAIVIHTASSHQHFIEFCGRVHKLWTNTFNTRRHIYSHLHAFSHICLAKRLEAMEASGG
jgi:hypothetical protein